MNHLVPCPNCARHVRQTEAACPFCSVELALQHLSPPALPRGRLGRAATFAFGASLVGATSLIACGGESETGKPGSGGANSAGAGGSNSAGAGGTSAGMFNGIGGNVAPPYGIPPLGGYAPTYGAPPGGSDNIGNAGAGGGGGTAGGAGSAGSAASAGSAGSAGANAGTAGSGGPTPVYGAPPKE